MSAQSTHPNRGPQPPTRHLIWLIPLLLVLALATTHPLWLDLADDALVASDPLSPADAIIVLAGHSPARAQQAQELHAQGYAPRLLISDERVETHGLVITWSELRRRGIAQLEVPDAAIAVLPMADSTYTEALISAQAMQTAGLRSAIVVTDAFHSRRALLTFRRVFDAHGLRVAVSPVYPPEEVAEQWWRDEDRALTILVEYLKMAGYALSGRLF